MRKEIISILPFAALWLASGVLGQEQLMKMKRGLQLGETAAQFFGEGYEKEMLSACATGDFKSVNKSDSRLAKKYCGELDNVRTRAINGNRIVYKGDTDVSEMRMDTFTFNGGQLVKVEMLFSTPRAESNDRGQSFDQVFTGIKQAFGPPTNETTRSMQDDNGVPHIAHREIWAIASAVILITEQPGSGGSTTLAAYERTEYDHSAEEGIPKSF